MCPAGLCPPNVGTWRSVECKRDMRGTHIRLSQTVPELGVQGLQADTQQLFLDASDPSKTPLLPLHTQERSEPGPGELQGPRM